MHALALLRETPWETRNLGVPSYAVANGFFEAPDFSGLAREMRELAARHSRLFVAARLSMGHLASVPELQQLGFYLVECTLAPTMALRKNPVLLEFEQNPSAFIPSRYQRDDLVFLTLSLPTPDWAQTLTAMSQSAFSGDRFHVDHQCPPAVADRRFAYWMGDLIADSKVRFDILQLKGKPIAFFARKENHQIVSGFAPDHAASGLGEFFWLSTCAADKAEGHTFVHSLISCNNLPSLNLCARCGYRFKETGYTFHFWENPPV
ncbi:MAG: hypothetical protein OEP48_06485 [Betaproteobacteria bacterium]|nr:hypothetical protein [Betaproteobacteria bacterium]MDH3436667.1 hypothetical protein [Betaproteobacteria bacterium]